MSKQMELSRRGFVAAAAGAVMAAGAAGMAGCSTSTETEEPAEETAETEEPAEAEGGEEAVEEEVDNTVTYDDVDIAEATADEVKAITDGSDTKTILVDARPQEAYAGWALEGAKNGGHLKNAKLFSRRWIDFEYAGQAPRMSYLEREMAEQGIAADAAVIVYDYTGEQAAEVAKFFVSKGVSNVKSFKAAELIDAGEVVAYEHYDRFVPAELVKSVSDVKTGKADKLSAEAAAVFGDDIDKIVLVDVGWGNAKTSSYYMTGHVPGAVHINTDCYERPRVYVPEKRSDFAKEWRLISLEEFRDVLCPEYGITKDSIVIGTSAGSAPICRLGFMLRCCGVKYFAMSGLLNGWKYAGYELDTDESTLVIPTAAESFGDDGEIPARDEVLWMDDILAIYNGEREGQICDNRDDACWNGEYSGYSYHDLAGRLDGSIFTPESHTYEEPDNYDNADGTPRTYEEYVAFLEGCGADVSKTMAFFCGDSWGAAAISYYCQSVDLMTAMQWGNGWIPWSNMGYDFIDHNGDKLHYDKWLDTVVDENGTDKRDGVNFLDDPVYEE